jgi:hypothetical protein
MCAALASPKDTSCDADNIEPYFDTPSTLTQTAWSNTQLNVSGVVSHDPKGYSYRPGPPGGGYNVQATVRWATTHSSINCTCSASNLMLLPKQFHLRTSLVGNLDGSLTVHFASSVYPMEWQLLSGSQVQLSGTRAAGSTQSVLLPSDLSPSTIYTFRTISGTCSLDRVFSTPHVAGQSSIGVRQAGTGTSSQPTGPVVVLVTISLRTLESI